MNSLTTEVMILMNGIMVQTFEWDMPNDGLLWQEIKKNARRWAMLGVTAAWLPPAYKGSAGKNDVGYGVYDLYDLGEFDQKGSVRTKYGTAQEYISAVHQLRLVGIQTLGDVVLNHRLGADETEAVRVTPVNPDNRLETQGGAEDGHVYTRFTFPGRGKKYSDFTWDHTCFTSVDWNADDPAHHLFLLDGKSFAADVDHEHGNFDYLMGADVDVQSPHVREELFRWGRWYLKRTGLDGFRLDAVKHISASFYRDFLKTLREKTGREVYAVGEYWSADLQALLSYLAQVDESMDLFDAPLHFHFYSASHSSGQYDLRNLFRDTLVSERPTMAVTFVDNHDTQPGQSLESWVDGWFKASAYSLILLREQGYPCIFWGDLFGIPSRGIGAVSELPALMRLRLYNAYGPQHDFFDDPDLVGFVREGDDSVPGSGLVCLVTDSTGGKKRMDVGKRFAGTTFVCAVGGEKPVKIDADGFGVFSVKGGRCSVYVPRPTLSVFLYRLWDQVLRFLRFHLF